MTLPFAVGVNYWPRSSGIDFWATFDAAEIGDDFAHIAALGLDTVRIFLRWDRFQPAPDRVDEAMLANLVRVADAAHAAGLRVLPVLSSGHFMSVNWLPAWALDAGAPRGPYRTFAGDVESKRGAGDLFGGPLLEAQRVFARRVGAALRDHPAIRAWDLGHAFDRVRPPARTLLPTGEHSSEPAGERAVAEWSRILTRDLRETSGLPATAGTHMGDLTEDAGIRLGTLCLPFGFASMQGDTVHAAFARGRLDPEVLPFLAMLAAGFSHQPVFVTGFGNPTCPGDKFSAVERFASTGDEPQPDISPDDTAFATFPCLTEHENAAWCANTLERLHADGRLGALWWCYADAADAQLGQPPYDRNPHAATYGIVRSDGSEKPVAAALSAFASQRRAVVAADDMPAIAGAYYYRTLPASTKTLFDAFLRFVAERRRR